MYFPKRFSGESIVIMFCKPLKVRPSSKHHFLCFLQAIHIHRVYMLRCFPLCSSRKRTQQQRRRGSTQSGTPGGQHSSFSIHICFSFTPHPTAIGHCIAKYMLWKHSHRDHVFHHPAYQRMHQLYRCLNSLVHCPDSASPAHFPRGDTVDCCGDPRTNLWTIDFIQAG